MIKFILPLILLSGCAFGVGPTYKKINSNDAFLLTQNLNKDIICLKDKDHPKEMRCYYVSGNVANEN
tara:strand:- start:230 stop:430 length:201 start_codon:yes stop_codon:yes gene_type:complete